MENKQLSKDILLANGIHFGHEKKRWNPLMSKYILGSKENMHIFDLEKTQIALENAFQFLEKASETGEIIIVGTKRQASKIIRDLSIEAGAHFVNNRWPGGLLTNFKMVKNSLNLLNSLEKEFQEGVYNRTKYEVSLKKKEWSRLSRLYAGVKNLTKMPSAIVVLDVKYESSAVREAKKLKIPVVGIVDSNSDPKLIDYIIPANDDAIKSIKFIIEYLGSAILKGNKGNGVAHDLRDYSTVDVLIKKETTESVDKIQEIENRGQKIVKKVSSQNSSKMEKTEGKGILEKIQEKKKKN